MILQSLICCPCCHGALGEDACLQCGRPFERTGAQLRFVQEASESPDATFQLETQNKSSFLGRVFVFGKRLLSSEFQPQNHLRRFLSETEGVVVELGSGSRRLRADIVTVDLFPSLNVDIVADIAKTPIKGGAVDAVILDSVIEHVPDPVGVVREARRILKPGGRLFINTPFMIPYHGYPKHYQNFTQDGLKEILADFTRCDVKPTFGPMTAWVNMTSETFAVLVGGDRGVAYVIAKAAALLPIFWLKYLDVFFIRSAHAHRVAGLLCAEAVK